MRAAGLQGTHTQSLRGPGLPLTREFDQAAAGAGSSGLPLSLSMLPRAWLCCQATAMSALGLTWHARPMLVSRAGIEFMHKVR